MSSSIPPTGAPGDSEPGPAPSLPGVALWSDSDPPATPETPAIAFTGLVATPADRAIPTIGHIGRYALKYQLGEGGLGTVFAAHDPLLSRLIAVKTLNVQVAENERAAFNALFLNEARAAGGLSHPHIVTVFDAGVSDERAYIAMELLKGRDLRQLRQEGWRATPAQAALIVRRVADALAFAHSKGVIHRDIKPANIFMVGRTQPRVLDFGIARVAHRQEGGDPHSGAGSPYYMAPEQMRRQPADRRADVFSLGVVLYELLTDTKPFRGESLEQIRAAVLDHEPPLASKIDEAVPKALALIAARAMAKDPEQRFRSARSFARELRQWLDENPAVPEGAAAATPKPRRRTWPLVAAASAVLALVAGAAFWAALPGAADAPASATAGITGPMQRPTETPRALPTSSVTAPRVEGDPAATATAAAPGPLADVASTAAVGESTSAASAVAPTSPALMPSESVSSSRQVVAEPAPAAPARATAATPRGPLIAASPTPSSLPLAPAASRDTAKEKRARESRERELRESEAR
ncbi:MAG: protein kinase, partial [Caldimonas sp.]